MDTFDHECFPNIMFSIGCYLDKQTFLNYILSSKFLYNLFTEYLLEFRRRLSDPSKFKCRIYQTIMNQGYEQGDISFIPHTINLNKVDKYQVIYYNHRWLYLTVPGFLGFLAHQNKIHLYLENGSHPDDFLKQMNDNIDPMKLPELRISHNMFPPNYWDDIIDYRKPIDIFYIYIDQQIATDLYSSLIYGYIPDISFGKVWFGFVTINMITYNFVTISPSDEKPNINTLFNASWYKYYRNPDVSVTDNFVNNKHLKSYIMNY